MSEKQLSSVDQEMIDTLKLPIQEEFMSTPEEQADDENIVRIIKEAFTIPSGVWDEIYY